MGLWHQQPYRGLMKMDEVRVRVDLSLLRAASDLRFSP
jgi:hypothetical protein